MPGTIHKYVYTSYIVQAINVLVNFIYSLLIVRLLGANGFGEYSIFNNSLAFFILLFGFNLPSVLVFFIANNRIPSGRLLFSSLILCMLTSLLLILFLMASGQLGLAVHIFPGGNNKTAWIILFVLQFFFLQSNQLLTAFLNAHKIFIPVSVAVLLMNVLLLAFWGLFSLGIIHTNVSLLDFIWTVNIFFNAGVTVYFIFLLISRVSIHFEFRFINKREFRLLAGFATIIYLCNTFQFLNYKMDIWFVHYFTGTADTGIYALALSLSQLIWILPNAISGVLLNYYRVNSKDASVDLAMHYGSISLYLSFMTAMIMLVAFFFVLPAIYGVQFSDVFFLCTVLCIGTVPFSLAIIVANLNSGIGFVKINLYATVFTLILGIILDLIFIPVYGMNGAAIAKVIIYLAGLAFQLVTARNLYQLPWTRLFKKPDFSNLFRRDVINTP